MSTRKNKGKNHNLDTKKTSWLDQALGKTNDDITDSFMVIVQNLTLNLLLEKKNNEWIVNKNFIAFWKSSIKEMFTNSDDYKWISSGIEVNIDNDKKTHTKIPNRILFQLKDRIEGLAETNGETKKKVVWRHRRSSDRVEDILLSIKNAVTSIQPEQKYPLDLLKLGIAFFVLFHLNKSKLKHIHHRMVSFVMIRLCRNGKVFEKLHASIVSVFREVFTNTNNGEPFPETNFSPEMNDYLKNLADKKETIEKRLQNYMNRNIKNQKKNGGQMGGSNLIQLYPVPFFTGSIIIGSISFCVCYLFFFIVLFKFADGAKYKSHLILFLSSCATMVLSVISGFISMFQVLEDMYK